jgi:hypothetical protein
MHTPDEPIIASEDTRATAGSTLETVHDNQPGGDDYDAIIQAQDRTDADLISCAINNEAEEARAAAGGGEVMIDGAVYENKYHIDPIMVDGRTPFLGPSKTAPQDPGERDLPVCRRCQPAMIM